MVANLPSASVSVAPTLFDVVDHHADWLMEKEIRKTLLSQRRRLEHFRLPLHKDEDIEILFT
jgi:hypothetical protein